MIAFALVLLLAALAGWIAARGAPPRARSYLKFAAVLYAALALGEIGDVAPAAVTAIVTTLGSAVLCLGGFAAFRCAPQAVFATLLLVAAGLSAIASAATGLAVFAAVPQVSSAAFLAFLARPGLKQRRRSSVYLALASLSLGGAAASALAPGVAAHAGLILFSAAGLVGVAVASDVLVEGGTADRRGGAIGRTR